jgi:hypothetical protein
MRSRLAAAIGGIGVALVVAGCVGPARDTPTYQSKAVRTATDSRSALQTALLSVQTSLRGRLMQAYLETMLSNSEDSFSSIQATFDSIQPPDSRQADQLRNSLDNLLEDGSTGMAQLRILARRRDTAALAAELDQLKTTSAGLARFVAEHA